MKRVIVTVLAMVLAATMSHVSFAEEKGSAAGEMKGSMAEEVKGSHHHEGVDLEAAKADMQNAMKSYIDKESANGIFELKDEKTGKVRKLNFVGLHANVGMAGAHHYSCADFKDTVTGEILDVDIYLEVQEDGSFDVEDAAVHKVDGVKQFKYGKNGERIPVDAATAMKGSPKGSPKGSDTAY